MAAGAAPGTLALTVPPNAAEDGVGELSEDGSCVMFRDCGTALTSVCVASGVRVAFVLVTKGDQWGVVGAVPQAAHSSGQAKTTCSPQNPEKGCPEKDPHPKPQACFTSIA